MTKILKRMYLRLENKVALENKFVKEEDRVLNAPKPQLIKALAAVRISHR